MRNDTDQCAALRIKNWHEPKETLSETVTASDNWLVFSVDSVYCTVFYVAYKQCYIS